MSDDKPSDKPKEPEETGAASDEKEEAVSEAEATSSSEKEEADAEGEPSSEREPEPERAPGKSKKRRARERAAAEAAAAAAAKKSSGNPIVFAVIGLAAGVAAGWFGHIAQAKAKLKADSAPPAPAASGSGATPAKAAPCAALEKEFCAKTGDTSAACEQAKGASSILTSGTCEAALETVPAMVEKAKAARAVCDQLVTRLCKDLTPESPACNMVKQRTPSFPPERCAELSKNYEGVLDELKQMAQRGMIPGADGAPPQGMPPGQAGLPPGHGPGDGHNH